MNSVLEIKVSLLTNGHYAVEVVKLFAPQYGGGRQTFTGTANSLKLALALARAMTVSGYDAEVEVIA